MSSAIRRKSAPHEAQDAVSVDRSRPQFGQNFIVHLLEMRRATTLGIIAMGAPESKGASSICVITRTRGQRDHMPLDGARRPGANCRIG
jgi:hypothetical protein